MVNSPSNRDSSNETHRELRGNWKFLRSSSLIRASLDRYTAITLGKRSAISAILTLYFRAVSCVCVCVCVFPDERCSIIRMITPSEQGRIVHRSDRSEQSEIFNNHTVVTRTAFMLLKAVYVLILIINKSKEIQFRKSNNKPVIGTGPVSNFRLRYASRDDTLDACKLNDRPACLFIYRMKRITSGGRGGGGGLRILWARARARNVGRCESLAIQLKIYPSRLIHLRERTYRLYRRISSGIAIAIYRIPRVHVVINVPNERRKRARRCRNPTRKGAFDRSMNGTLRQRCMAIAGYGE